MPGGHRQARGACGAGVWADEGGQGGAALGIERAATAGCALSPVLPVPPRSSPPRLRTRAPPLLLPSRVCSLPCQTVERHLQRQGAAHVEGCGAYEDHHMFSLEEIEAAIRCGRRGAGARGWGWRGAAMTARVCSLEESEAAIG